MGHSPSQPKISGTRQDAPNAELVEILAEMGRDGDGACEVAAKIITAQDARIGGLEKENFALAANQCHAGYGDDYGNHRCEKIDALKDALLGLIEAVELDSDKAGKGISGYTAARLTDARTTLQPTAEPVRRCKHDVSEDCPACAEETIAGLKARCEAMETALRKSETVLGKIAAWLGRLATASEQRAKDNRFPSLADANAADAKNYRATIVSIMPALESARAALPQPSTPAVSR